MKAQHVEIMYVDGEYRLIDGVVGSTVTIYNMETHDKEVYTTKKTKTSVKKSCWHHFWDDGNGDWESCVYCGKRERIY